MKLLRLHVTANFSYNRAYFKQNFYDTYLAAVTNFVHEASTLNEFWLRFRSWVNQTVWIIKYIVPWATNRNTSLNNRICFYYNKKTRLGDL